jgi:hypothetical protein
MYHGRPEQSNLRRRPTGPSAITGSARGRMETRVEGERDVSLPAQTGDAQGRAANRSVASVFGIGHDLLVPRLSVELSWRFSMQPVVERAPVCRVVAGEEGPTTRSCADPSPSVGRRWRPVDQARTAYPFRPVNRDNAHFHRHRALSVLCFCFRFGARDLPPFRRTPFVSSGASPPRA